MRALFCVSAFVSCVYVVDTFEANTDIDELENICNMGSFFVGVFFCGGVFFGDGYEIDDLFLFLFVSIS
jgi:hypothetical protein